ncbi:MAG: SLC13 family permease, partial [Cellulosilyticaceae bacterium]
MKAKQQSEQILEWLKKECVLVIAVTCALISCAFATPKWSYIDVKVLILLFNLMMIVAGFKALRVLDYIAVKLIRQCHHERSLFAVLVGMTFVSAMFVTNDVALITFVPLALIIGKRIKINLVKLVVLQTLAANLGSSLTPMGNPQNLFIYSFYQLETGDFFRMTILLVGLSVAFLAVFIMREPQTSFALELEDVVLGDHRQITVFAVLFVVVLLSVFHVVPYEWVAILVVAIVLVIRRELFLKVDYSLLMTFVGFFIFVGNMGNLEAVKEVMYRALSTPAQTYWSSILASQVISNVPAAMLVAPFTTHSEALLLGVNIGGLGTLIASMASVISYKLYAQEHDTK